MAGDFLPSPLDQVLKTITEFANISDASTLQAKSVILALSTKSTLK